MKDTKKAKGKKNAAKSANTLLIVLCALLLAVSVFYIARYYSLMNDTNKDNQILSDMYKKAQSENGDEPEATDTPKAGNETETALTPSEGTLIEPVIINYPRPPEEISPAFEEAYKINPDVIGYLHVPQRTVEDIDLFVCKRDNEYYLTHDFYGEEKKSGTLFLDEANQIWPQDQHLIIYGHNMKNGTMFARLPRYKALEYAYNNPFVYFDTLYETGAYVVVAAMYLPANEIVTEDFNLRTFTFGETSMNSFMYKVRKRAMYVTGVDVNENDQLLSLVTCAYNEDDERFILITRRIRENETEEALKQMIK